MKSQIETQNISKEPFEQKAERWLTKVTGEPEKINGGHGPVFMLRWILLKTRLANIYIHKFTADDNSADLHDHPKRFISIGLRGEYTEELEEGFKLHKAPWIRQFPASHKHRILLINGKPCWTLVITFWKQQPWGFWRNGKFIPLNEHNRGFNDPD